MALAVLQLVPRQLQVRGSEASCEWLRHTGARATDCPGKQPFGRAALLR